MQKLRIRDESELLCPICQAEGECSRHFVEKWREGNRRDHLKQWIGTRKDAHEWETKLLEQLGTLEECFTQQMICVSWITEDSETLTPLFSGRAISKGETLQKWHMLFHPQGKLILREYQFLVEKMLTKSNQIQRILGILQAEPKTTTSTEQQDTTATSNSTPFLKF